MSNEENQPRVREVIGIFIDGNHLKGALSALQSAGFDRDQLGLLASEYAVEHSLGDLYTRINAPEDESRAPATAFVEADSVGHGPRSMGGGLFFAGSTAAVGAVVASAAVLGGALLPAVAGVAAVGAIGTLVGSVINRSDAEYLEDQVDKGHILLFVRAGDPAREKEAMRILSEHSAQEVKVHEVPLKAADDSTA
jgi:outer membrane lipoprotein SlyB